MDDIVALCKRRGFIFPASLLRPLGGYLSDRFGARSTTIAAFAADAPRAVAISRLSFQSSSMTSRKRMRRKMSAVLRAVTTTASRGSARNERRSR